MKIGSFVGDVVKKTQRKPETTCCSNLRLDWQDPNAMGLTAKEIQAMNDFNPEVVIVELSVL